MTSRKIVVLDGHASNPGDLSWDGLKAFGELTVYERTPEDQVLERIGDADIVLTNKVPFKADRISKLPHVKYIGVLATGYNIIDTQAAAQAGIIVTNIPAYSTDSVAQITFAHILNITNHVSHYAEQSRAGRWTQAPDFCYWDTPLIELAGKTIGIVGLGNIGMHVAQMARLFGMDVFAFTSKNSADLPEGIQKATMEGLLGVSDILTLHCPLTPDTFELINADTLSKMKRGAILINTGRGQLVNEADVAQALRDGQLSAYGADVMCQEPPTADNPLLSCPNAYLTPHIAWASFEARQRLLKIAINNVAAFIAGTPQNVVTP
jgi:glycerate dehydrogenase